MTSLKQPNLSLNLLDKLLAIIKINKIEPIICFTKQDLLNELELKEIKNIKKSYEKIGYKVFFNNEIEKIKKHLQDKIVVLTGQSGAGKSSFLNKLDENLNLKTSEISLALNRGVHTTRHVEIYEIENINFVDTPGFSALDLKNITIEQLKKSFLEFTVLNCKYLNCDHDKEDGCEVKNALKNNFILESRYKNYLKMKEEIYENSRELYK